MRVCLRQGPLAACVMWLVFIGMALTVASARAQSDVAPLPVPQYAKIPIKGAGVFGSSLDMVAEVFQPAGAAPFPVLVYLHGRDGTQAERLAVTEAIPRDYLRYWLDKGFAVVAPMRPGYGKTGGADREVPGHRWESGGNCTRPDFAKALAPATNAATAALDWTRTQSWARPAAMILSGNSVGGITSVSAASANPAGVVGFINFAGGMGGNPTLSPGRSCDADQLRALYAQYGKTGKLPGLWVYADNDLFWGADAPRGWHAAYIAGGAPAELAVTGPVPGHDGHELIFVGRALWRAHVDGFVAKLGLP